MQNRITLIAEAGVNHNGDINIAKQLVDAAQLAGVDIIKFQTWKTELLVTEQAKMADYQILNSGEETSQYTMLKGLELSYEEFKELKKYCDEKKITFLSTPDEEVSATFLNNLQPLFKIGSGELTNIPFLKHIATFKKPVILSTGMGTLAEIECALVTLTKAGLAHKDITVLHATTEYPTPINEVNLNAMITIKNAFPGISVGYSDHTLGIEVPIAAAALGATVIEKHFTLDKNMEGPDHAASLEPLELKKMVESIRNIEHALGDGRKQPTQSELKNRTLVRKSIVALKPIKEGDWLDETNIGIRRPDVGLPPSMWDKIIHTTAKKSYDAGDPI